MDEWSALVRSALGLEAATHLEGGVVVAAPKPVRNAVLRARCAG